MGLRRVLSVILTFAVIFLFVIYWFIPISTTEFLGVYNDGNSNFNLDNSSTNMQFYNNMRFPSPNISYKIHDCPLYKSNGIEEAFDKISNLTVLKFNRVSYDEEISAFCSDRRKVKDGLFIAGEGGPTNITKVEDFNVISHGEILLIKESKCSQPNIGIHEILHALGFDHSTNPNSIMYNVSRCNQDIGEDIIDKINSVYSSPTLPDLSFENVSAVMHGKYLDSNISIRNNGLIESKEAKLMIYADDKKVKELSLNAMDVGYGSTISLNNIWVFKIGIDELRFLIEYDLPELKKNNNEIKLKIKN